jgi:nitrate/nitrite transport system ATP-binding protein
MHNFVELYRLGKTYDTPTGPVVIVENFDLRMSQGEFVSILGHSGCGKSTVLSMVAGLNPITEGGVVIAGREIEGPGTDRGVVFQSPCLMPWLTALENVRLAVDQVYPHGTRRQRIEIAEYYLSLVGLRDSLHRRAIDLSQGMQQRVGIARAFSLKPKMLLLDEPFGMLDSLTRLELQEILLEILSRDRVTTLMITHDVDESLFMSDRVVMMTNGPRARIGKVFEIPFQRPRVRKDVLEHESYYSLRGSMINFLEEQEHRKLPKDDAADSSAESISPTQKVDSSSDLVLVK